MKLNELQETFPAATIYSVSEDATVLVVFDLNQVSNKSVQAAIDAMHAIGISAVSIPSDGNPEDCVKILRERK